MRFSNIATVYFMMGVIVFGTGVVPLTHLGLAEVFIDVDDDGSVAANQSNIGGVEGETGMLDNLIGPVKNALNTITGGALLAVWNAISQLMGFYAWPIVTTTYLDAPNILVMLSAALVVSFTFGALRVFVGSL